MTTAHIELPPKLIPVFSKPRGSVRYRGAYGGRGSGKSFSFALMAAVWGYAEPMRILCTRELQVSIPESFYAEVKNAINTRPWLKAHYHVGESFIRGRNGTEFIFRGLRHNMSAVKSMAKIDLCIVEEAEDVPEKSWRDLTPTIRAPRSEIWVIWNPSKDGSPVDTRFRKAEQKSACIVEMNYMDNPWFPAELEQERQNDQRIFDPATYAHIWEGAYLTNSEAQVLSGKVRVDEFEPDPYNWDGPYFGVDFGFSQDPTTGNKLWIKDNTLYVEYEANKVGLELDDTAEFLRKRIPDIGDHIVRADSARPESISYLKRTGIPKMVGVKKGKGSVEDGIKYLRSFDEIVIHPRCQQTIKETRLYSYKTDRLTGDILPVVIDAHNHHIDAMRYALEPIIRAKKKRRVRKPGYMTTRN